MQRQITKGSESARTKVDVRTKQTRVARTNRKDDDSVRPGFQDGSYSKNQRSFTTVKPEGFAGHVPHDASIKHRQEIARVVHANPDEQFSTWEAVVATVLFLIVLGAGVAIGYFLPSPLLGGV